MRGLFVCMGAGHKKCMTRCVNMLVIDLAGVTFGRGNLQKRWGRGFGGFDKEVDGGLGELDRWIGGLGEKDRRSWWRLSFYQLY
jgi:hypothetical protein